MKSLKIISVFTGLFFSIMLFFMIYRVANGRSAFVSVRVLFQAIERIDLTTSFDKLYKMFYEMKNSAVDTQTAFTNVNSLQAFRNAMVQLFETLWVFLKVPFNIMITIGAWIYDLFSSIIGVFTYVLNY